MSEIQYCRVCFDYNVRMHQISGSTVQDVYEKLTNHKIEQGGQDYFACYICYCQLKKSHQLVMRSQKSQELLKQIKAVEHERDLRSIISLDRHRHGLIDSLVVSKTELFQVPEYNICIKTDDESETVTNEVIVKDEPLDSCASLNNMHMFHEKHSLTECKPTFIESGIKQISRNLTNTSTNENSSSQIIYDVGIGQELVKEEKKYFVCNDCGKMCDTKDLLIEHINGHKSVIVESNMLYIEIQESICNDNYIASKHLKEDPTYKKSLQCQYCNYTSKVAKNLKIHTRTHTGEKPFKCKHCDYISSANGLLKRHMRTHTGERPHKCPYCKYSCADGSNLKIHIRTHTGEKPFECQYCNYTCKVGKDLKIHTRTHTGEKPFKCKHCDYKCIASGLLKRHMRTHTGERPHKCPYCKYASADGSYLKIHIRTHTGEKPFECQYCNYTCKTGSSLKKHMTTHSDEKLYKCPYCNFSCALNSSLKIHITTHTEEKPFKCQYCNYTCRVSSNLKNHIRTHTGEKPFKCKYCDYTCAQNSSLKVHLRSHTGEKPFKCQYCNYTCAQNGSLKNHIRTHTGEYPI